MQCCLTKISFKFTDKVPFLAGLSVSKTHFTDKPAFSGDLSVNFWPLCWGFTDKRLFLEHLSVKPDPKRLNFYGQPAFFDHFVRKRQIFCQMQRSLNRHANSKSNFLPAYFRIFASWTAIVMRMQKPG